MKITTVGLDLAKNVFQVHGIDEAGEVVVRKTLRRRQMIPFFSKLEPCLIGMEACGTSHHWARTLSGLGHRVKLMPPAYVKPYVKRGKTDAADAEAICEAVTRQTMRFVAIKSPEQQSILALHRTRDLLIRQRTQLVNMIRAQLAEFGIVVAKGIQHALRLAGQLVEGAAPDIPALAVKVIVALAEQLGELQARIGNLDKELKAWSLDNAGAIHTRPFRGSGLSRRRRWRPRLPIRTSLPRADSLPPGSVLPPEPIPAAARSVWGASPRWATGISGACW